MRTRQHIQVIPSALQVTLEKARGEYEPMARQVRWGEGPIYICGTGSCAALAPAAACVFESMLGWPVVARPVEVFQSYAVSLLRPRSVLIIISATGAAPEAEALAHLAHERGCALLLLTNALESSLAKIADHVFLIHAEGDSDDPAVIVCLHAALNYLAFTAARLLKRHEARGDSLEREFAELHTHLDWVLTQFPQVVRSMAAEITPNLHLQVVGAGFFQFPAWRAAYSLRASAGLAAQGWETSEFINGLGRSTRRDEAMLLFSGSRSKIKNLATWSAIQARNNGTRVFCITDNQDRELADQSDLGILVPTLMEATGSTLSLCLGEWLAVEAGRLTKRPSAPPPSVATT